METYSFYNPNDWLETSTGRPLPTRLGEATKIARVTERRNGTEHISDVPLTEDGIQFAEDKARRAEAAERYDGARFWLLLARRIRLFLDGETDDVNLEIRGGFLV